MTHNLDALDHCPFCCKTCHERQRFIFQTRSWFLSRGIYAVVLNPIAAFLIYPFMVAAVVVGAVLDWWRIRTWSVDRTVAETDAFHDRLTGILAHAPGDNAPIAASFAHALGHQFRASLAWMARHGHKADVQAYLRHVKYVAKMKREYPPDPTLCRLHVPGEIWYGNRLPDGTVRSLNHAMCGVGWGDIVQPLRWNGDVAELPTLADGRTVDGEPRIPIVDPRCIVARHQPTREDVLQ